MAVGNFFCCVACLASDMQGWGAFSIIILAFSVDTSHWFHLQLTWLTTIISRTGFVVRLKPPTFSITASFIDEKLTGQTPWVHAQMCSALHRWCLIPNTSAFFFEPKCSIWMRAYQMSSSVPSGTTSGVQVCKESSHLTLHADQQAAKLLNTMDFQRFWQRSHICRYIY